MTRGARLLVLFCSLGAAWPALAAEKVPAAPVTSVASSVWESLWRNADQRGAQLLNKGDAKGAAKVFADPRRKAYAELLAGDYANAAKGLGALDDGEAHYNRGNALAHSGQLQDALKAYDAALKRDPKNTDARHNRDLVEKALEQQKAQTPPQDKQKSGDHKSGDGKSQQQSGKGQDKSGSSGQNQNGQQDQQSAKDSTGGKDSQGQSAQSQPKGTDGKPQDGQGAKSDAAKPSAPEANAASGKANGADPGKQSPPASATPSASAATADNKAGKPDSAKEARRDAENSLGSKNPVPATAPSGDSGSIGAATGSTPKTPPTEKQLAQAQWLRSIPDDPGGLLRRKFMIEHYMRQQKAAQ